MDLKKQNNNTTPIRQRLYDAISTLDGFIASFQNKLRQNDDAKEKIDNEKHKKIADIDNDVESFRTRTLATFDKELKKKTKEIDDKIQKLNYTVVYVGRDVRRKKFIDFGMLIGTIACLSPVMYDVVFVGNWPTGVFSAIIAIWIVSILIGVGVFAGGFLGYILAYIVLGVCDFATSIRLKNLKSSLTVYTAKQEREKEDFLKTQYEPYKSRKEEEKEPYREEYDVCKTKLLQQRQEILADFARLFPDRQRQLEAVCREIQRAQPQLDRFTQEHLTSACEISTGIVFGRWQLDFWQFDFDEPELKQWSEAVPHLIDFPFTAPFFDVGTHNKKRIDSLLLRLLFALPVGMVELTIIDPVKMGQSIEDFLPLLDIEKLVPQKRCLTHPDKIEKALLELIDYSAEQLQTRLRNTDWLHYNETNQENPLPYKVLLIFDYPDQITSKGAAYLKRILENGMKCGILPIIWITEDGLDQIDQIESRANPADKALLDVMKILQEQGQHLGERHDDEGGFEFPRKLNAIEAEFVHESFPKKKSPQYLDWIAEAYGTHIESKKADQETADRLKKETALETEFWHPQDLWSQPSTDEISVPIGKDDHGNVVAFTFNDNVSSGLLAGIPGSGKSVLLHVIIQGLSHRYSPEEITFYLMDYKDGVEFNRYAKLQIPHTRLVVASKAEAEYGMTVLEHLQNEATNRYKLFSESHVSGYKEYRAKGHVLPRVLLIVDEFQVLFQQSDAVTKTVVDLLSDVAGKGRAAGVHLLLSTQSVRALLPVPGFTGVKEKLASRIALASSQDDSEYILGTPGCGNTAAVELRQANTDKTRYGILNTEGGHKGGNTRFLIPYPDREKCDTHQKFLAEEYVKVPTETSREVKIFDGSRLPQIPPVQEFEAVRSNSKGVRMMLGEEFNFEAKPFVIDWEQKRRKNLCIAGADEAIRKGLLHSLLLSVDGQFERVIYFNTNPHFEGLDLSIANLPLSNLEQKRFDWNCDIADILADFKERKTLLIVDPLDEAEEFHPPANFAPLKEGTPAYLLKQFLEDAPLYGSYTVAFVDSWQQFKKQFKDSLPLFELRIGFQLHINDAGDLTGNMQFKGLESNTKAVFANIQRNEQVLFRPFIVPGEK